jgi:hypothetical protein
MEQHTLTVTFDTNATPEERSQVAAIVRGLRGVERITSHTLYSTGGKVKEVLPQQFEYWNTITELILRDPLIPIAYRRKIAEGVPVRWEDKTLTVQHEDPEWANDRWARTCTNLCQGLCPGAKIEFVQAVQLPELPILDLKERARAMDRGER